MMPTVWRLLLVVLLSLWARAAVIITTGPDPLGHAEVHDMIRNSEQRSWCLPGLIRQIVTHVNCISQEVENKVCAGSCFSYSLPQTQPEVPGDEALQFCESCQPSESQWINVTLECTAEDETTYEITKSVQQISNCTCSSCPGLKRHDPPAMSREEALEDDDQRMTNLLYRALPPSADGGLPQDPGSGPRPSLPPTLASLGSSDVVASLGADSISVALALPPAPPTVGLDANNVLTPATRGLTSEGSDHASNILSLTQSALNSSSTVMHMSDLALLPDAGSSIPSMSTASTSEDTIETVSAAAPSLQSSASHSSTTAFANLTPSSLTTPSSVPDLTTAARKVRPSDDEEGDIFDNSIDENSYLLPRVRQHEGSLKHDFPGPLMLQEDSRNPSDAEQDFNILHSDLVSEDLSDGPDNEQHQGLKDIMTNLNAFINRGGPIRYNELSINELKFVLNSANSRPANEPPEKPAFFNSPQIEGNV